MTKAFTGKHLTKPSDTDFFESLYQKYYIKTRYFAQQYLTDQEEAEEIAQETFITLWQQREDIKQELNIQSFILTIAKNKCLNILRKRISTQKYKDYISLQETAANISALSDNSFNQIHYRELQELIENTLHELPPKTRLIYQMNREQQMPYNEIAQSLQLSVKSIEYHMTKALAYFHVRLKDYLVIIISYHILICELSRHIYLG